MNRICKCGNKIGLLHYIFGLRICEDCDMSTLKILIAEKKEQIKISNIELLERKERLFRDYLYTYSLCQAEGINPPREIHATLKKYAKELKKKNMDFGNYDELYGDKCSLNTSNKNQHVKSEGTKDSLTKA